MTNPKSPQRPFFPLGTNLECASPKVDPPAQPANTSPLLLHVEMKVFSDGTVHLISHAPLMNTVVTSTR